MLRTIVFEYVIVGYWEQCFNVRICRTRFMESIVGSKFVDFSINDRCVETVRMYLKSVLLISLDI